MKNKVDACHIAIRWSSSANAWLDCLVFVEYHNLQAAARALQEAMDEFYANKIPELFYGDYIEKAMHTAGLPFYVFYAAYNTGSGKPTDAWLQFVQAMWDSKKIRVELTSGPA